MERLTIDEVSRIIGDSPHQIRYKCRYDMYDPPICRKVKKKGGSNYQYQFFMEMLKQYVGNENLTLQGVRDKA